MLSYDGPNHELMVHLREDRVRRIANDIPPTEIDGPESGGTLIVGWGSTQGSIKSALRTIREQGREASHVHLRYLNPLPNDLGDILRRFDRVIVPELNLGQLAWMLRARYLVDVETLSKVQGRPFKSQEIIAAVLEGPQEASR